MEGVFMKKNTKKYILIFLCIILLLSLFIIIHKNANLVNLPDKIIIYKDNKSYTITKDDKDFNKIVQLTNKRISKYDLAIIKDIIDDGYIAKYKKETLDVEFIYNQEQTLDINTWKAHSIKYNKLFFILVDKESGTEDNSIIYTFQYGNANSYIDSSRGPIKSPEKLIKLINSMDLK